MKELLYLKDDQLKEFIEKIFMSYRDTFSDSKKNSAARYIKVNASLMYC